jgi:predicted AlkP superfamily phosphohydrolase/phosphomutase
VKGCPRRVLVLGLDGATFDVIDPLIAAGRLPQLAALRAAGAARPLRSSVPPMSFPAWSTFLTGTPPGRHGIFDFTQKVAGAYRIRFVNASQRRVPSFLARATAAGRRALCLGVPATFPPERVDGLLVAGFDAPVSSGTDPRSASDPELYRAIAARAGPWKRPDLDEGARDPGWHERAVATLTTRVEHKATFACEALAELERRGRRPDLAVVVFAESDTVAHHYWRDHDPRSPRHDPAASAQRRGAVAAVYERLDAACGALRAAFGDDALCAVVSDHGSGGAARRVVHLNQRLADCGLLVRGGWATAREGLARAARDLALRRLSPRAAEAAFRRARGAAARVESAARFGGLDWRRTRAFSEEANTQPGVWINLRGREARGCVATSDYEALRSAVIDALLDWKLPAGGPVVVRARRREEVYTGPHVELAPDVVVELALDAGYGLSLVATRWSQPAPEAIRSLADDELAGGRGRGMNGTHRQEGIWIADEALDAWLESPSPGLEEVAPALLAALGVAADADRGRAEPMAAQREYTPEEEARVAARLRALGYLE